MTSLLLALLVGLLALPTPSNASSACDCMVPWPPSGLPLACTTWFTAQCAADPLAAYCAPDAGSGLMAAFIAALEPSASGCGKEYVTAATYKTLLYSDFLALDRSGVALHFMLLGTSYGLNPLTNPNFPDLLYASDIYGRRALSGTPNDFINVGLTDGNAHKTALIRNLVYTSTSCSCVTEAWTSTGPVDACIAALCDPLCGGNESMAYCEGDPWAWLEITWSEEGWRPIEVLANR